MGKWLHRFDKRFRRLFLFGKNLSPVPKNALSGHFFWWRHHQAEKWSTTISLIFPTIVQLPGPTHLLVQLRNRTGQICGEWKIDLPESRSTFINTQTISYLAHQTIEGQLSVWVIAPAPLNKDQSHAIDQLTTLIDWHWPSGKTASLHSDQRWGSPHSTEWTEIRIRKSTGVRPQLVVCNGPRWQAPGSIQLQVWDAEKKISSGRYQPSMAPFSWHRIDIEKVCGSIPKDQNLQVIGRFDSRDFECRPYVIHQRQDDFDAYHGGDRYPFMGDGVSEEEFKSLDQGEMNPMALIFNPQIQTRAFLFHSHGSNHRDFDIDARIFRFDGQLIIDKKRVARVKWQKMIELDIRQLLPDLSFIGHIEFRFSNGQGQVPKRLQALMEYATRKDTSHIMAWSDRWNTGGESHIKRATYRVFENSVRETWICITHCSNYKNDQSVGQLEIQLINFAGSKQVVNQSFGPRETLFLPLSELFPLAKAHLESSYGVGVVQVQSTRDFAILQFTRSKKGDRWSAEHFMSIADREGSQTTWMAGM